MVQIGIYLPEYYLTPETIFRGEVLAFDIDFFNPEEHKQTQVTVSNFDYSKDGDWAFDTWTYETDKGNGVATNLNRWDASAPKVNEEYEEVATWGNTNMGSLQNIDEEEEVNTLAINSGLAKKVNSDNIQEYRLANKFRVPSSVENGVKYESCIEDTYADTDSDGKSTGHYKTVDRYIMKYTSDRNGLPDITVELQIKRTYYNFWISTTEKKEGNNEDVSKTTTTTELSLARELRPIISAWYKTLRNIAIVALLSVLVYIGIRITLCSVSSDKAKYKQMLVDWVIALCLVFLMHYIMSFAVTINKKIIEAVNSISISSIKDEAKVASKPDYKTGEIDKFEKTDDKEIQAGVELFRIEDKDYVKEAYKVLVDSEAENDSNFAKRFTNKDEDDSILFWPANDFMTQARLLGQNVGEIPEQEGVAKAGYNIIYVVLVIYTIIFCFIYLKRVVYMAFLTMIAPLVAITYPIDKINDGKAQAFDLWFKEYLFNLLIQPMHLILYTVLVGSAMEFAATNIFYVVVALGFLMPAEKLIRRFFGFDKAQTPGTFGAGAAAGTALMMTGLNKLMNPKSSSNGKLGEAYKDKEGKDGEEDKPKIRGKDFDEIDALMGGSEKDNTPEGKTRRLGIPGADTKEEKTTKENTDLKDKKGNKDTNNSDDNNIAKQVNAKDRSQTNEKGQAKTGTNTKNKSGKKRKLVKPRRAIRRGLEHYGEGLKKRYIAKGGIRGSIRRGLRTAGGIATGAVTATAGGIIGITTGDASKALQYATTGAVGGYALGKSGVDSIANTVEVPGTIEAVKQGYYGDDYKKVQEEKFKKEFMKDNANLRKIEDKYNVDRKEAKAMMENEMKYYLDNGITNMDEIIATDRMQKELDITQKQALATQRCAKNIAKGQDTNYMSSKEQKELEDTFRNRFKARGSKDVEKDVKTAMRNLNTYNKFMK